MLSPCSMKTRRVLWCVGNGWDCLIWTVRKKLPGSLLEAWLEISSSLPCKRSEHVYTRKHLCIEHTKHKKENEEKLGIETWTNVLKFESASDGLVRDIVWLEMDTKLTAHRAGEDWQEKEGRKRLLGKNDGRLKGWNDPHCERTFKSKSKNSLDDLFIFL